MADANKSIDILWNIRRNESDWERHNETQRATLTALFLAVNTAILGFLPKDRILYEHDWPMPAFMIVIGIVGVLGICKYWERFMYHSECGWQIETELDKSLGDSFRLIQEVRKTANGIHNKKTFFLFRDNTLKQHWIWITLHCFVTLVGVFLLYQSLSHGAMPAKCIQ